MRALVLFACAALGACADRPAPLTTMTLTHESESATGELFVGRNSAFAWLQGPSLPTIPESPFYLQWRIDQFGAPGALPVTGLLANDRPGDVWLKLGDFEGVEGDVIFDALSPEPGSALRGRFANVRVEYAGFGASFTIAGSFEGVMPPVAP